SLIHASALAWVAVVNTDRNPGHADDKILNSLGRHGPSRPLRPLEPSRRTWPMRATSGMLSVPRVVRAVATALLLVGCSEPTALVQDGAKVGSVVVTPLSGSVNVGSTIQLTATVLDTSGQVIAQPSLSWRSSDTLIARISAAGVVRGVVPGTVTITARSSTKEGSAHVVVAQLDTGGTKPDTGAVDFAAIVRGIRE